MMTRILVVAHNHPDFHPGGTEIFARDLFMAYKAAGAEALFLAATNTVHREQRPGTSFQAVGPSGDEVVLWAGHFDRLNLSQVDSYGVVQDLIRLLEDYRPDVVHLHHLLLVGAEFPFVVRRVLPEARIVLTLHDYYPICHRDGLMVRTTGEERCDRATPSRCHACFPEITADKFLLRERHLKTLLRAVDRFVAPSAFLRRRYIDWGLPADRIDVIANARPPVTPAPTRLVPANAPVTFGYFGNLSRWKGVPVLLKAAERLREQGVPFELRLHGGMPFQTDVFKAEIDRLAALLGPDLVRLGAYTPDQVPALMTAVDWVVVPSIWWENAPLVIQEAFQHRRPVITSGIGGMAEMVDDGVTGLHAAANDPSDLARVMRRAAEDRSLQRSLAAAIPPARTMEACAAEHLALFDRAGLIEEVA
ncbi:glycosyltransferase family 4 protein [Mongoliimonas terrestris]|uniref:glycosyltransferase family 4 protein n=1 Tax=Mongoliimonas terrestris TaxID=1709001 RepID=UPI000BA58D1A|nr:glycosyltransferase family 4 protein [Mongoliimonas terrestris]